MRKSYQTHPYHVVTISPWPLLTSLSLLYLTTGLVSSLQEIKSLTSSRSSLLVIGIAMLVHHTSLWFRDIISEGTYLGSHTKEVRKGLLTGFYIFILTEIFFFVSIFWSFFHSSLSPSVELGNSWPPYGISSIASFSLPFVNTILLLSSGATVTYGHHMIITGNRQGGLNGLILTLILSLCFLVSQYIEYRTSSFTISDSIYGSTFYFTTGTHSLHVIVGSLFLFVNLVRYLLYSYSVDSHIGLESSIVYWHFVDIVWIFVFIFVYWWSPSS